MISLSGEIIFCCIGNMRLVVRYGGLEKKMWIVQSSFGGKISNLYRILESEKDPIKN